jgi:molybdopterin-guanine dinucleotide biosynthesis protein A
MGVDKASIEWGGTTLVDRAVAVLAETCGEVMVAGGSVAPAGVTLVPDTTPGAGPAAGLDGAYGLANGRPLFVLAVDMPLVDSAVVMTLTADPIGEDAVRIPVAGNRDQPLCGLYGGSVDSVVTAVLDSGDRSMAQILKRVATVERVPIDPEKFLNVNTPDDLDEALRRSGLPPSTR